MRRSRQSRIYWRIRNGVRRAYADFRDFTDVGGKREALVPAGARFATTDPDLAASLVVRRLAQLAQRRKRNGVDTLARYARDYLIAKKLSGQVTDAWLAACEGFLRRAVAFFGTDRPLEEIKVSDVRQWAAYIQTLKGATGRRLGPETARRHLFALSNLYRFAQESEHVPPGFNPVAALSDKPAPNRIEARWLEVSEGAVLLEAARTLPTVSTPFGDTIGADLAYPIVATFLLTGGRRQEVLGLELDDLSFDRQTVTFRPNQWRRLKNRTSWRVLPLWPQLEEILRVYVFGYRLSLGGRLLFPSFGTGREAPLVDPRKMLDRVVERAGWKRREIYTRVYRHTYCAARLQTLDHGAPVSLYTVSREMGHASQEMVERIYAHLGTIRHRSPAVEYRVEQHAAVIGDRLARLGIVTRKDTRTPAPPETRPPRIEPTDDEAESYDSWARRDSNPRPLAPEASALSN